MQYQSLGATAYADLIVRLISAFEGHEPAARDIGDRKATIGWGYTFNRNDNVALWTAAGITLSAADLAALAAIDAAPANQKTSLALSTFKRSLSRTEAQSLLEQTYTSYEGPALSLGMPLSLERAAFVSLTYNRGVSRANSMTAFAAAIQTSDRAEAWYQIRYGALGNPAPKFLDGVAKRRFVEAQIFGLYDNPNSVSDAEARQTLEMLTEHRVEIYKHESRFGIPPDGSTANRNMIAVANGDANISAIVSTQSIFDALVPARDKFIAWVNSFLPSDRQIVAATINPAATYYLGEGAPGVTSSLDARLDDGKAQGLALENNVLVGGIGDDLMMGGSGNDILIGRGGGDVLDGGKGADLIYGGSEDDRIIGGEGNDTLYGGDGDDVYIWNTGDGNDTIVDDGGGTLIINGSNFSFSKGTLTKDQNANIWRDKTGNVALTHNSPWRIELADGTVIQLGENFDPEKWGITLKDSTEGPQPTNTYTGDYEKALKADGHTYLIDGSNYAGSGEDADSSDILFGSEGGDFVRGLGGADALFGYGGNDLIQGGEGADILMGGLGADTLNGGAGNDVIYGSSNGTVLQPTDVNYAPPSPQFANVDGYGFSWVVESPGRDEDGVWGHYISDTVQRDVQANDQGNTIDAGEGDDAVLAGTGDDSVHGGEGGDDIHGLAGDDELDGDSGADRIYGDGTVIVGTLYNTEAALHGSDLIDGGAGNDTLLGQGGDDAIYGGADDDKLWGDDRDTSDTPADIHGDDYLDGGSGADELVGGGGNDVLFGGSEDDKLWGDSGAASVGAAGYFALGRHGDDYLDGQDGNDYVQGEGGNDILYGGTGDDTLVGDDDEARLPGASQGEDFLDGEDGDDLMQGGGGGDTLLGGAGADTLDGDAEELQLSGELHGDDYLDGEAGDDVLVGRGGNDTLIGGDGNDALQGDAAEEFTAGQFHGDDYLEGGDGNDSLWGLGANDTLIGGSGNDYLAGDGSSGDLGPQFHGDDYLEGGDGNDALYGGGGNDVLSGGAGADELHGGAGDDVYQIVADETTDGIFGDTITDNEGTDSIELYGVNLEDIEVSQTGSAASIAWGPGQGIHIADAATTSIAEVLTDTGAISFQELLGQRLQASTNITTAQNDGRVMGGAKGDTLVLTGKGNRIWGGRGDDSIYLNSASGNTVAMNIGDGIDVVSAVRRAAAVGSEPPTQNVLELSDGFDESQIRIYRVGPQSFVLSLNSEGDGIRFTAVPGSDGSIPSGDQPFDSIRLVDGAAISWQQIVDRGIATLPTATEGDDNLTLSPISDVIYGFGGNDRIEGLSGNDTLDGGAGDDTLLGGVGNDELRGGTGVNSLFGGDGDDRLYGGDLDSYDLLEGGEGSDTYYFRAGNQNGVDGKALDSSQSSSDTYRVRDNGGIGGWSPQSWYITDQGGTNDQLIFETALVTNANTKVTSTGNGFRLNTWNVSVYLENALDANGNLGTGSIEAIVFKNGVTWTMGQLRAMCLQSTAGDDSLVGFASNDSIDGGAGADWIEGYSGNDTLLGGAGYDTLAGGEGDDTLDAGTDGAVLSGGTGADTYMLRRGNGQIQISGAVAGDDAMAGVDTLLVDGTPGDVTISYTQLGGDYNESPDQIEVKFTDGSASATFSLIGAHEGESEAVEHIAFNDGTTIDVASWVASLMGQPTMFGDNIQLSSLSELFDGGEGNDSISGGNGNDSLYGSGGDDFLQGGAGDDILDGGAGDDFIALGTSLDLIYHRDGHDTVVFGAGYGHDEVGYGSDATLLLKEGVSTADFTIKWNAASFRSSSGDYNYSANWQAEVVLSLTGGEDSIQFEYTNIRSGLGVVVFSDGTHWTGSDVYARANVATEVGDLLVDANHVGLLAGGGGNDTLLGLESDNILDGGSGDDLLYGGDQNDRLIGGSGNDLLVGGRGVNTIVYALGDGFDTATVLPSAYEPTQTILEFAEGIDPAVVQVQRDTNNLRFVVQGSGGIELQGINVIEDMAVEARFADGTVWGRQQLIDRVLTGASGADVLGGFNNRDDLISGGAGDDVLSGFAGSDTLNGGEGNDTLYASEADTSTWYQATASDVDVLIGGSGDDLLYAGYRASIYVFEPGFGHDTVRYQGPSRSSAPAAALFKAGIGPTDVVCSRGPDYALVLSVPSTGDTVRIEGFFLSSDYTADPSPWAPLTEIRFESGEIWSANDIVSRLVMIPTSEGDLLFGADNGVVIDGLGGDDRIFGGLGDDTLIGGQGNDTLMGYGGHDRIEFGRGDGLDVLDDVQGADLVLGSDIQVSDVTLTRDGDDLIISMDGGEDSVCVIGFLAGANQLNVRFADGTIWDAESMLNAVASIYGTSGNDSIVGTGSADRIFGLQGNDTLVGGGGNDYLDGGAGNDTMQGGGGDDTYIVDSTSDLVSESSNAGYDVVRASVSYTASSNVEVVELTGTANINATGNSRDNELIGNEGNNVLNGSSGADYMEGGLGNDTYVVDNVNDWVEEDFDQGIDTVQSSITYSLGETLENLTLTGSAAINGEGNGLDNVLTGNSASNVLYGDAGNDTYVVGAGDTIVEYVDEGIDTVQASVSWTLGDNLENLTLTGTTSISGAGNELSNVLMGNSAANSLNGGSGDDTIDGGSGNDTMVGGTGDDTYFVNATGDVVTELAGEGMDEVRASITYTLGNDVESLVLTGTSTINATGNTLSNNLTGNSANNTLDGGAGDDTMVGGAGADTYKVDSVGDVIVELSNEGTDAVQASVTYTLSSNIENLTLTGTGTINGTGNELDNVLTGNTVANILTGGAGNDTLDGGTGNDTLVGGLGNDTYKVDATGDVVTEAAGEGLDTVQSSVTYTLGNNVENLTLTGSSTLSATGNNLDNVLVGNTANNTLTGAAGNDTLDGGTGNDTMVGGTGDDTYYVNISTDVVTENASEGTDTVISAVTYTLGNNVENLQLQTGNINGTGNALDNVLYAGAGNNTLNGQGGTDTVSYLYAASAVSVSLASTSAQATGGSGSDTLSNLENLTGSNYNDSLTGSTGANILRGGLGNDTINGGTGADSYLFGRGDGQDTVTDADSTAGVTDALKFDAGISIDQIWFRQVGNNLEASIIGTNDTVTISNWYSGAQNHLEQFKSSDGKVLLDSQVQNLVQAMASFSPPAAGQVTLPPEYQSTLSSVIAANWQ
ncbi:calcium-binding protein [Variovorax ureilyticus]|uniref:Calcium-binding protein n=1 Tax=Variovorax ureilyticus TaxID=1836198 RepID=A0ABU8VLS1_9BURK